MDQQRNTAATRLAVRHYLDCMRANKKFVVPALLLPGIGNIFVMYVPPLFIAKILAHYSSVGTVTNQVWYYVSWLAVAWLFGELVWRAGTYYLIKADALGIQQLYLRAMDYLLAKDTAFFNNHFVGSLTKKTIGYAKNYETFLDTISYNICASFLPLIFVMYVLWQFSP